MLKTASFVLMKPGQAIEKPVVEERFRVSSSCLAWVSSHLEHVGSVSVSGRRLKEGALVC